MTFYINGTVNSSGLYDLEFNSKSTHSYSISVSDDLIDWYDWVDETGNDGTITNIFDPSSSGITGLNINSNGFYFRVDIEEDQSTSGPGGPGGPGGPSGPGGPGG